MATRDVTKRFIELRQEAKVRVPQFGDHTRSPHSSSTRS